MDTPPNIPDVPDIDYAAEEREAARVAQVEAAMAEQGQALTEPVQHDYFGFAATTTVPLPKDAGRSWITIQKLAEGARLNYQNATNKDVRVQQSTKDMILRMAPGTERHKLLELAIVGWNLVSEGQPVPFTPANLARWLRVADPSDVNVVEKAIRLANPWLLNEMSSDDIRKEIADLEELLAKKLEEEAGNGPS